LAVSFIALLRYFSNSISNFFLKSVNAVNLLIIKAYKLPYSPYYYKTANLTTTRFDAIILGGFESKT